MHEQNLDIYGHAPIPWSRALKQLEGAGPRGRAGANVLAGHNGSRRSASPGGGGRDLGGWQVLLLVSGPRLRKSRNLASNPSCALSVSLDDLDVVVEGAARKVTDPVILDRVANLYASLGWPARASGGAITAEYSAPSAGRGPWDLYEVVPNAAVGVATKEPHGATRWRFDT